MRLWMPLILVPLVSVALRPPAAAVEVTYNHHIRPLLSDRCFVCHGPDARARKAGLRLDTEEGSRTPLADGGLPIWPGDPARSEVVRRIHAKDAATVMPPPESNLWLSSDERSRLEQWIKQGAKYERHWAFIPVPPVASAPSSEHPIDAIVGTRLRREGLAFAPPASRAALARRLSFDLTGLPLSPEEVMAFVADPAPDAYERLVGQLLASPHYGERKALDWLDLARYADTYGYQSDVEVDFSPWRDWVIRAFNENLPYDEFLRWQLAGDLLPDAKSEQVLATAFNRLHRQTNEGGSIDEEFRVEYVSDRVHTFGTAMLGLTLECARCHDHKYDPISQRDYYALSAFFNNIDESGLYSHFTRATPNPTMLLYPDAAREREHEELRRRIAELESQLAGKLPRRSELPDWDAPLPAAKEGSQPAPDLPVAAFAFDEVNGNRSPNRRSTNAAQFVEGPRLVPGRHGQAVRFSGDNEVVCRGTGHFSRTNEFSLALWLMPTAEQERAVVLHHSRAWSDSGSRGYELVLEQGRPFFALIHFWPGNAIAVRARDPLPLNEWVHLTLTYDGSSRASGLGIWREGRPLATEVVRDHLFRDIQHRREWGDSDVGNIHLTLGGRFRDSGFRNGLVDELRVFDRDLAALEPDPEAAARLAELKALRAQENNLAASLSELMVMREMPKRRPTYVLERGAYDERGETVEADTPAEVLPFDPAWPRNRLGLAQWLTDRRNPLAARVAVNRVWHQHFGRGLAPTMEDFGAQGRLPAQPELLDFLAAWFMDRGWDVKALHRLIVTSATYRQSSQAAEELLARDPDNELLARGPKHRLSGEALRDQALAVSGLLNAAIGGRSVKPYQPAGLWEESGTGKTYTQDKGDKLYRRSLYTFWRRTAPPPAMTTFDAPTREVCTAKRETTTTPLQSLVLLNDPQFVEAARVFAARLWRESDGQIGPGLELGFLAITGRPPDAAERALLERLFESERGRFTRHPEAAQALLKTGEHPVAAAQPPVETAALALVMSVVMNYDEALMKR